MGHEPSLCRWRGERVGAPRSPAWRGHASYRRQHRGGSRHGARGRSAAGPRRPDHWALHRRVRHQCMEHSRRAVAGQPGSSTRTSLRSPPPGRGGPVYRAPPRACILVLRAGHRPAKRNVVIRHRIDASHIAPDGNVHRPRHRYRPMAKGRCPRCSPRPGQRFSDHLLRRRRLRERISPFKPSTSRPFPASFPGCPQCSDDAVLVPRDKAHPRAYHASSGPAWFLAP